MLTFNLNHDSFAAVYLDLIINSLNQSYDEFVNPDNSNVEARNKSIQNLEVALHDIERLKSFVERKIKTQKKAFANDMIAE